jgi:hypothetical protein
MEEILGLDVHPASGPTGIVLLGGADLGEPVVVGRGFIGRILSAGRLRATRA